MSAGPAANSAATSDPWYIIPCPPNVELTSVAKERGTHGSIYVLWECDMKSSAFVGQSVPALVRSINEKAITSPEKRLHASSLYRCLRREARKESHKLFKREKSSRSDIAQLNAFLAQFPSIVVTSKSPELWRCTEPPEASEEAPGGGGGSPSDGAAERLL